MLKPTFSCWKQWSIYNNRARRAYTGNPFEAYKNKVTAVLEWIIPLLDWRRLHSGTTTDPHMIFNLIHFCHLPFRRKLLTHDMFHSNQGCQRINLPIYILAEQLTFKWIPPIPPFLLVWSQLLPLSCRWVTRQPAAQTQWLHCAVEMWSAR